MHTNRHEFIKNLENHFLPKKARLFVFIRVYSWLTELGLRNLLGQFSEAPIDAAVIERAIEIRKSVRIKIPDASRKLLRKISRAGGRDMWTPAFVRQPPDYSAPGPP